MDVDRSCFGNSDWYHESADGKYDGLGQGESYKQGERKKMPGIDDKIGRVFL